MSKNNVIELAGRDESQDPLTDMLRTGAQQLIQQAVEAELQCLLAQHADSRTSAGTAGVVRNGYLPERDLQTSLGPVPVKIPKVRSKTGEAVTYFQQALAVNPKSALAHYNLAIAFAEAKIYREAIREWEAAADADRDGDIGERSRANIEIVKDLLEQEVPAKVDGKKAAVAN